MANEGIVQPGQVPADLYLRFVANIVDYAIFFLDKEGYIASWNEGARRIKGYRADEIVGHHFSKFYRADDIARDHPADELETALREGRYEEEGWRIRKDGTEFWASVTITALHDDAGRHVGFAKVTRDLTVRKHAEEELRRRALSYANLNRELDAFSQAVAHDIRSPVRAVEHLSRVLLEEEASRLSEQGRSDLRAIHTTAHNMARLVQDLLELSAASIREPQRADVDVSELASEVGDEVRAREPGRPIEFRVEKGLRASADRSLLKIALTNLLANAAKFTRNKERALVEIGEEDTKEGRAFYVRDNGAGFDPSRASELFHPFSRLHAVSEFEGTGIGLATVARIVRRHEGKAWADGEVGRGATFHFTLEARRPIER